jgi:hypothetical protein
MTLMTAMNGHRGFNTLRTMTSHQGVNISMTLMTGHRDVDTLMTGHGGVNTLMTSH